MSQQPHLDLLRAAQAEGLLPESASWPDQVLTPWPVTLITAIGAWLATIPLVAALHLISNGALVKGAGPYLVGLPLLFIGLFWLRKENQSLFKEQFILAALVLVGLTHIGFGLWSAFPKPITFLIMALLTMGIGWVAPRRWLQSIFGALAGYFLLQGVRHLEGEPWYNVFTWTAAHTGLGVWILSHVILHVAEDDWSRAKAAARVDAIAAGWSAVVLLGLALCGGSTAFFTSTFDTSGFRDGVVPPSYAPAISVLLACCAAGWAGYRWPTLLQARFVALAMIAAGLTWAIPAMGAIFVVLAFCASSGRHALACTAGVAAMFTFSAFYYQLDIPLVTKALMMTAIGALLAAIAWIAHQPTLPKASTKPAEHNGRGLAIVVGALIVLVAINASIWQKEKLISTGEPVLVELGPADPRSLLQGDFMRLWFTLPDLAVVKGGNRKVVGQRNARGVTQLTRVDDGAPLKPGELRIDLVKKNGGWTLVTDAWYFAEGDAKRWEDARYGEFRVEPSGKALLVGLRDANLRPIR